jgi:tetratricopeptide (TPR) repeat protein
MGRVWVVVVGVLLLAGAVRAEKVNPVEKLAADAAAAYRAADFQRAVTLLERAYKLQPVAALLYNLAKAYEKLGDEEKAGELYAKYAGSDDADPKLKAKAEAKVASLRPEPRARPNERPPERTKPPTEPPPPARVETAPPKPVTPPPPPADPEAERRKEVEHGRTRDRGIAIGLGAVGVAALASAIGLSVNALSLQSQFDASTLEAPKRDLRDSAKTQALAADLLYAGAAVCVGLGAYFLWRGLRPIPSGKIAYVAPWASPTGGGLTAGGAF